MSWNRQFTFREFLKNSLWLVPVLAVIFGVALRVLVNQIEQRWPAPDDLEFSPDAATTILTSIVAAMISFTGFVLTILVLVIQFTGASFSPRVLLFVFRDRQLKLSLGLFAGTIAYSFLLLTNVSTTFVPSWGVLVAGILVIISLMVFLHFLSHLLHGIRPANMARRIGAAGHQVIAMYYPNPAPPDGVPQRVHQMSRPSGQPVRVVRKQEIGEIIQAVDIDWFVREGERRNVVYVLPHSIGSFVPVGSVLIEIFGSDSASSDDDLLAHVAFGSERTVEQDPAFPLRVVTDIAVKAFSQAINDPTTGTNAIDIIEDLLIDLVARDLEGGTFRDRHGEIRLVFDTPAWEDFLQIGVTEIRRFGASSIQTTRRLIAMLERLMRVAPPYRLDSIRRELDLIHRSVPLVFPDPEDQAMAIVSDPLGIGSAPTVGAEPHVAPDA